MQTEVVYDHLLPEILADPYPAYERLREHAPVYYNERHDLWALSRFADVQAAFRDWETFTSTKGIDPDNWTGTTGFGSILMMDPPSHDSLRRVLRGRFTPKAVREGAERTERVIRPLVASAAQADRADLAELASNVALESTADLLGLSETRTQQVDAALGLLVQPPDPETRLLPPAVSEGAELFSAAMDRELAQRRRGEYDDVMATIARHEASGGLDRSEAIGLCAIIFFGAVDTSAAAISITLYLLATHPDLRASVLGGDVTVAQALEECIRYHAPVQWVMRTATRDVETYDRTIPKGGRVLLLQGSANRDSRQFERADVLDFDRPRARHFAFGEGVHFCIGAVLARLWGSTAITELLRHAPEYSLDGPAVRAALPLSYGLDSLPVRLRP
jgi:cytochrome P450